LWRYSAERPFELCDGSYLDAEVKQGSIISLPLAQGMSAELEVHMLRRGEIEEFAITSEPVKVRGGVCGVVLDARGRPVKLSAQDDVRRARLKEWENLLGAK